jgi:hypothetical protein
MNKKFGTFENELISIFDITKSDRLWLYQEDKALYSKQLESAGKVGYNTNKIAPSSSIHPPKLQILKSTCKAGCSSNNLPQTCEESDSVHSENSESAYNISSTSSHGSSVQCQVGSVLIT